MSDCEHREIWERLTHHMSVTDALALYKNPYRFQIEFSEYINKIGKNIFKGKKIIICELGCNLGVTSLLLSSDIFERHCLDLNADALKILSKIANQLGEEIKLHHEYMFRTSFVGAAFDIVFNSGVLEHYSFDERKKALIECTRIVKPGGRILIGVPNHFSLPYRLSYKMQMLFHKWRFPPEERIKDFSNEIHGISSLNMTGISFFDKESIFSFLRAKFIVIPFRILDRMCNFEPYLRVIEFQKVSK